MTDDPRPNWARHQNARRRVTCDDLRIQLDKMPNGHVFWAVFNSSGGQVNRMMARSRDTGVSQTNYLPGKPFSKVIDIDISWTTMHDEPDPARLDWVWVKNWAHEEINETMRIEEIDDDDLNALEMFRAHRLWDKFVERCRIIHQRTAQ